MLALLSRFFLQDVSFCLLWLDDGGDDEELVLARESSSDIPVWIGEEPGPGQHKSPVLKCFFGNEMHHTYIILFNTMHFSSAQYRCTVISSFYSQEQHSGSISSIVIWGHHL